MMTMDHIISMIERNKTPYIRISDHHGNKIVCIENTSVNATVNELKDLEPMLTMYGKLDVQAADKKGFDGNFKGAFKWTLFFSKPESSKQQTGFVPPWQTPTGYVHQDVMSAKLEAIQKEIKHERELRELKEKYEKKDGFEKYLPFVPAIMAGLGWGEDKIEKMMKYSAQGKAFSMAGEPTNTLTFKDVEKMTPEEKNKKIQTLLDSLSEKVSAENMILLLEALDKKPELAEKAVNLLPML